MFGAIKAVKNAVDGAAAAMPKPAVAKPAAKRGGAAMVPNPGRLFPRFADGGEVKKGAKKVKPGFMDKAQKYADGGMAGGGCGHKGAQDYGKK